MKTTNYFYFSLLTLFLLSCKKEDPFNKKAKLPLHNKKVLILGNSITQNGKYIDFIEYYLRKNYPQDSLNIISIGLSSETASGDSEADHSFPRPCIHSRLDKALQETKPDLVLASYGMNDGIYSELDSIRFSNYKKGILKIKNKVETINAEIIFLTPTPFDASRKDVIENSDAYSYMQPYAKYNNVLKAYANWLNNIEGVKVIDLNTSLNNHLKSLKKVFRDSTFIPDGIHPNHIGHFYMAKKALNDLYPDIKIADPITEINQLNKDSLFKLVSKRRAIRSNGWLKYIGYIKKDTVKINDIYPTQKQVKELEYKILEILNGKANTLKN